MNCQRLLNQRLAAPPCRAADARRRSVQMRAVEGEYNASVPNMQFVRAVIESFPEEGVANVEEARALYQHGGYDILDIRTPTQVDRFGKVPACARAQEGGYSICVPYKTSRRWFEDGKMQEEEEPNEDFLYDVEDQFDKDAKIMVMDFDGQTAIEALELLDDNGFTNIVGVQGGFKKWFKAWDTKLKRRNLGEYQEHSWGEGECSTGIHASGAGFANQDAQSGDFWKSW